MRDGDCIPATTTTNRIGVETFDLRAAREDLGVTRAQLAALAGVSIGQLANIEQGAIPKRSRVLEAARRALADVARSHPVTNETAPAGGPVKTPRGDGARHDGT